MTPTRVALKDGRHAIVRPAEHDDAPRLLELWRVMACDGGGMVADASDFSLERVRRSIASYVDGERAGDRGLRVVAIVDGQLAGEASIRRLDAARVAHVATLGVGLDPRYRGLGLGRALMGTLIDWARRAGVVRLDLAVRADNEPAIGLYDSLGFRRESVRERFVREKDGRFVDDWVMVRFLDGVENGP